MVRGANVTESEVSRAKGQLRRMASRRVLAKPGLAGVLEALKMARDARLGKMGCNPASFLQVDQDFACLFE